MTDKDLLMDISNKVTAIATTLDQVVKPFMVDHASCKTKVDKFFAEQSGRSWVWSALWSGFVFLTGLGLGVLKVIH